VAGQPKRVAAESISFNNLGTGIHVFLVDTANQVWLGEIQLVITLVDEHAFGIEQRAHCTVAKYGALLQPG
jgi:hypothetical protein